MSVMDLIVFAEAIHHVRKFRRNTGNSNITEALQSSIILPANTANDADDAFHGWQSSEERWRARQCWQY